MSLRRTGHVAAWLHPRTWLPTAVALAVVGVVWQRVAASQPYLLPSLAAVADDLRTEPGVYLDGAAITLGEALAGLAVGMVAAVVLAVAIFEVAVVRRALFPLAVVLSITPVVALAPSLGVALGYGPGPKVVITAVITFFPVLIGALTGLRSVPVDVLRVFTSVRASRWEVLWRLRAMYSLPFVFAALRVVFPLSIIGAVVAEFSAIGGSNGLGTVISVASSNSRLPVVYAAVACLAVLGLVLLGVITVVERRVLSWHESQTLQR